jgi:hypothetical protein
MRRPSCYRKIFLKVFGIELRAGRGRYFFLETDMGTEPLSRDTHYVSSIYKKVVGYDAIYHASLHKTQLNFSTFRVLFLTSRNIGRANLLLETSRERKPQ